MTVLIYVMYTIAQLTPIQSICPHGNEQVCSRRFWNPDHLVCGDGVVVCQHTFGGR